MRRTNRAAFRHAMGRDPGKVREFAQEVASTTLRPTPLPPQALYEYWHPAREGSEPCPRDFDRTLKLIHPDLFICRAPARAPAPCDTRWIVWTRKPENQHYLRPGWQLLFLWPPKDYAPIPLDNRIFANLAIIDARRYGTAVQYFDRIVSDLQDTKVAQAKAADDYRRDRSDDYYEARKIKNIGHGSKFALHHDGTILPSRGHQDWERSRGRFLPSDVVRRDDAECARASTRATVAHDRHRQFAVDHEFAQAMTRRRLQQDTRQLVHALAQKRESR